MAEPPIPARERRLAWTLVLAVVVLQGFALWHEVAVSRVDLNDNVLHFTLVQRMTLALAEGDNPLDFWASEWTLGYPVSRTYQPLGHLAMAGLAHVLGEAVELTTLFAWVRYLLLCLWPLTVYVSARWLTLGPRAAAAAALVAPFVATNGLYGLEYGSYLWRGSGLYTQSCAMHLLALTLGLSFQALRRGGRLTGAGLLLGLTFLAHFIYGYIGALSVVLMALVPGGTVRRVVRVVFLGSVALAVTAFQVVPLLLDSPLVNRSRWEPAWKWDSFGAGEVLKQLASGDLLDFGRFPSLSLLALLGAAVTVRGWIAQRKTAPPPASLWVLGGAVLWLALFCGRPTWGVLFDLLGASEALHLHRLIGGAHLFLILLCGIGLGSLWGWAGRRRTWLRAGAAVLVTLLLLWPALRERTDFLAENRQWGRENLAALKAEEAELDEVFELIGEEPGRVYPGLAAGWGGSFKIGSVPLYAFLSQRHVAAVAFLYHSMALTSDVMTHFNEQNPAHYLLFNVSRVVAEESRQMPAFLTPMAETGRFRLWRTPASGYFDLVAVPYSARIDKRSFYDVNKSWLESDWVLKKQHLRLDLTGGAPADLPRLAPGRPLPPVGVATPLGTIERERRRGETYSAEVGVDREAFLLFKMTYHRNWQVWVDGERRQTVMLSPGFAGVALPPGRHVVEWRYQAEGWKTLLLALAVPMLVLGWTVERQGVVARVEQWAAGWAEELRTRLARAEGPPPWLTALGLTALALPVCLALMTSRLPSGHDAFVYLPRLVEFHVNVENGVLLPRWAPDVSAGHGQPLLLFAPPLFLYLAEAWHLVGLDPVSAMNAACVVIVLTAAWAMFRLGAYYFGRRGGWLAAAAYVYAPYFLVDLYVRRALAEFTAFALFPLVLYALARCAEDRRQPYLLLAALAYAGLLASHYQQALLFTPVLVAFAIFNARRAASWRPLARQGASVLLGLGISAAIWLPVLREMEFTKVAQATGGYTHYSNHFVYPQQLLFSPWGYGLSQAGYREDGMSFALGWAHLLLVAAAAFLAWRYRDAVDRGLLRFFAGVTLALVVLTLPGALWLWDHLPPLAYVQFPWRLLAPGVVFLALLVGSLGAQRSLRRAGLGAALALIFLANVGHARPERHVDVHLADWTPGEIARRGVVVSTGRVFEPREVETVLPFTNEGIRVVEGRAEALVSERSPALWRVEVRAETDALLELAISHFPGWTVERDGEPLPVEVAAVTGQIRFRVRPGEHRLRVRFARTTVRRVGETLSLLSIFFALGLWWAGGIWGRQ